MRVTFTSCMRYGCMVYSYVDLCMHETILERSYPYITTTICKVGKVSIIKKNNIAENYVFSIVGMFNMNNGSRPQIPLI